MLLEGIFLPLTTPFHPDGRLFLSKLLSNVARYSLTPAQGMAVLGSSGEGDSLSDAETGEALRAAIGAAADEKVMVANVGRGSVAATLELAEVAAAAGYDAVTVRGPAFCGEASMEAESAQYFLAIADRSPLPVVVVSDRERMVSAELIGRIAGHTQIAGAVCADRVEQLVEMTGGVSSEVMVTSVFAAVTRRMRRQTEAAGNLVSAASLGRGGVATMVAGPTEAIKTRTKRAGFQVLAGSTGGMLEAWSAGAVGAMPRLGACAPQACCEVWQAFKDGDPALAAEKQERIRRAGERMEGWHGITAMKYGCDLNGYFGGRARLPLLPLTAVERDEVEGLLAGLKN